VLLTPGPCPALVDGREAFEHSTTDQANVRTGAPYGCHDDCAVALPLVALPQNRGDRTPVIGASPILFIVGVEWRSGSNL